MSPVANRDFSSEFLFSASRGSGPGGQNVNKVASKIELRFHVDNSVLLTEEEKQLLQEKFANKINQEGFLQITAHAERSQLLNKQAAIRKFYQLLQTAFRPTKPRKATKPTLASIQKRLQQKHKASNKKATRRLKDFGGD